MVTFDKTGFLHHEKRQLTVFVQKKLISENSRVYFWLIRQPFGRIFHKQTQLLSTSLQLGRARVSPGELIQNNGENLLSGYFSSNMHDQNNYHEETLLLVYEAKSLFRQSHEQRSSFLKFLPEVLGILSKSPAIYKTKISSSGLLCIMHNMMDTSF